MRRKVVLILLVLGVALSGGACGRQGSEINEIGLIYEGGSTQEKKFKGFLEPGSTFEKVGWGSKVYRYRTDQRTYRGDAKNNGADTGPAGIASKDRMAMNVDYQLYFKLNLEPKTLQKFHENIGVKTKAYEDEGWRQMLRDNFEPQIDRSLEAAALGFNAVDLYSSEDVRIAFQNDAVSRIKQAIKEVIGDDYFCGPSYTGRGSECGEFTMTVGKPTPTDPEDVNRLAAEQRAAAATIAQQAINEQTQKKLEADKAIVDLYGPQGAILYKAIESGKVQTFIVDPNNLSSTPTPQAAQK